MGHRIPSVSVVDHLVNTTRLYGYACQWPDGGPDLKEQTDLCRQAALARFPDGTWMGCFQEPVALTTEHLKRLTVRKAGRELFEIVKAGDHVFVDLLSRIFVNSSNYRSVLTSFERRKVEIHVLDLENALAKGTSAAAIARDVISVVIETRARQEAAWEQSTVGFMKSRSKTPFGTTKYLSDPPQRDANGRRLWIIKPRADQQEWLARVVRQYEEEHMTFQQIARQWVDQYTATLGVRLRLTLRDLLWYYKLGRFYRENKNVEFRFLNARRMPKRVPRWKKFSTFEYWRPYKGVIRSAEQQAEIDGWKQLAKRSNDISKKNWSADPLLSLPYPNALKVPHD